mmetsp:Transcript_27782/g.54568  ORF Transcript_27782/g.54568 Transcript_27782/m.54568 type:complete len:408 (-) Transcript_27782:30-1253(-)
MAASPATVWVGQRAPSVRSAVPGLHSNSSFRHALRTGNPAANSSIAASVALVFVATVGPAVRGRQKCARPRVRYLHCSRGSVIRRCTTSGNQRTNLVAPPSRWAGGGVGSMEGTDAAQLSIDDLVSGTVVLSLDTPVKDVIGALLRSHAVCVQSKEGDNIYVKVTNNGVADNSNELDQPADGGYACIALADLLEAPRELPLSCLVGEDDEAEECELYGSLPEPYKELGPLTELASRLPWLVGLLFFLTVSSAILEYYDDLLQRHLVIAFYLTALVGCGGNAGSQAAALVLQGMATGELAPTARDVGNVIVKEFLVGLGVAAALCTGVSVRILLFGGDLTDALMIALAMAVTVLFSIVFGALAPLALQRLGLEPAKISGPLLSTVVDIFGVLVACLSAALFEAAGLYH